MNAIADFFTRFMSRYMPDPLVIAIILTFLTAILAILIEGTTPAQAVEYWGDGFWNLLAFTMQMTVILLSGYILARTPIVDRLMDWLISPVNTPRGAIIAATAIAAIASWLNWGFGLVIGTLIAQKLGHKVKGLHYPLVIAAGYSGFVVYGIGLSGSIPLLINTPGHFLEGTIGLVPLSSTIFSPVVLGTSILILVTMPFFNALLHPKDPRNVVEVDPGEQSLVSRQVFENRTPADRLNNSAIIGVGMGAFGLLYTALYFWQGGSLTLNSVNLLFLFLGIMLFVTPNRFLSAVSDGVKILGGIIIQFPFYAGILGILSASGLVVTFANWFVSISSAQTLPLWSLISAGLINLFVPSGGGQWVIQGPVMMEAAGQLGASVPATAMGVAFGDQWTNMVQPFWLLPALAISGLKLRDIMGYLTVILFFQGVIFLAATLLWGYAFA